jgi:hypothetical protein
MPIPEKEYESLRQEILQWQSRRLTIASLGVAAFLPYLPWLARQADQSDRNLGAGLGLALLGVLSLLMWICGRSASAIGAYIEVFLEAKTPGWESRIRRFDEQFRLRIPRFNWVFGIAFLFLSVITLVVARVHRAGGARWSAITVLVLTSLFFAVSWALMTFKSLPRRSEAERWREIQRQEAAAGYENNRIAPSRR